MIKQAKKDEVTLEYVIYTMHVLYVQSIMAERTERLVIRATPGIFTRKIWSTSAIIRLYNVLP